MKDMIEDDDYGAINGVRLWVLAVVRWFLDTAFF